MKSPLFKRIAIEVICLLYILLFIYAATSKLLDFSNFQVQIAQSPLLSAYAGIIAPLVIAVEFLIVLLLWLKPLRSVGLYASFSLMVSFTVYIYLILNYSEFIPCSCGGILEKLGWTEHMAFNIFFILLAVLALLLKERASGKSFRKIITVHFLCMVLGTILVIVPFLSSEHIIKKENNFTRRFLQHPLEDEAVFDLGADSYYFAGYDDGKIFLGNSTAPQILTLVDTVFTSQQSIRLTLDTPGQRFRSVKVQVRKPYFYIYDGTVPAVFRGRLSDSSAIKMDASDIYFSQLQFVTPETFAFRAQSDSTKTNVLGTFTPSKAKSQINYELLSRQNDGVFDTDGMLLYDRSSQNLVYSYFYRNEFLIMDSGLNLLRRLHTIDTISRAQVKVRNLPGGRHKMDAPPLIVNRNMEVYNNLLLVESNLMGKFETTKIWDNASVIDIYDTREQSYLGSFFIEHRGKKRLSQMLLTDEYLFVLSGREMLRYRLAQAITRHFKKGRS
ncbi:MAG: MauE/DoxX family redox-associated membrane protein [Bacteroidia bacterium]